MRTDPLLAQDRLLRAKAQADFAGIASKVLIALVVLGILAAIIFFADPLGKQIAEPARPQNPTQVTSYKSEIKGVDEKSLPYTINAEKSVEDKVDRNLVHLEAVGGVFERPEGKTYNVTSQKALYDRNSKQLVLEGKVRISNLPRMEALMDKAEVDTVTRSMVSKSTVEVTLENGFVTADELKADNNGERLVFKGRVKARFNN